jgi:hypothetical protein
MECWNAEYWSSGFEDITPLIHHYSHLTIEAQRAGFERFEQLERLELLKSTGG